MAGLNSLISDTTQQATTLPSWMSAAQQDVVNRATLGANVAPGTLAQTAAQPVVSQYGQAATNPFLQAQGMLQQIGSGAANPWITDASGRVTPNTATPLGGLFAAQQQQLNQVLPTVTAPTQAAGIGTGGFGGLRAQTAVDTARANALANLQAQQMQEALSAQQYGVQAGQALGNIGQQAVTGSTGLAALQQAAPFATAMNLGKTLSAMPAVPTTETKTVELSPLSQAIAAGSALQGGVTGLNALINQLSPGDTISSVIKSAFGAGSGGANVADAQNQAGGFYGGSTPTNVYADMTEAQRQYAVDHNFPANPSPDQIAELQSVVEE